MPESNSKFSLRRDENSDKQIVESFTKYIRERYKDDSTSIRRIDCEFSEYTKEYFGIVEGVKSEGKDFVEVFRHSDGWHDTKLVKPKDFTQRIDSFIHNYFQFDFDTITIGITDGLANNLLEYSEQTKRESVGNAIAIIRDKKSNRSSIEIFDYFMTGAKGEFHMEVMEPVYQKTININNKNMEER